MRYATVTLTWTDVSVHPLDDVFAASDAVGLDAIRYVSPVHEGQYVELLELRGDRETAASMLADSPEVVTFDVTGTDGRLLAYVQCRSAGLVDDLLAILREHEIVLDWPMRATATEDARGLRLTVIGTSRAIQRATSSLPEGVDLSLERIGEYEPDTGRLSGVLTDRQLELFELAVAAGYFEVPRETTQRELAAKLDVAPGTVGEHLQRIESKLVSLYVD
ncbi:helix-turn-helix domain-containing protein [Halorussus salilacus]|uniref:helix-turn-helix domain-containing protein n=1 Tax=Halorussus salilacus TaxID=2953750 RepID=UPI0020A1040A|nr:helix-turn-helix domain-containing protein [Halorussus salilacus]USZ66703.1 helix-turn-helix domain-containing protein [Halorussus salilacus]